MPEYQGLWVRDLADAQQKVPNVTNENEEKIEKKGSVRPLRVCASCRNQPQKGNKFCRPCMRKKDPIEEDNSSQRELNRETEDKQKTSKITISTAEEKKKQAAERLRVKEKRAAEKAAKKKQKATGWAKCESSSVSHRRVAKNKWRQTYKGPAVLPEDYLMEEKDRFGFGAGND